MRPQQEAAFSNFVETIANSKDLHLSSKLSILEYTADECFVRDNNLLYLECKQAIKELHGQTES